MEKIIVIQKAELEQLLDRKNGELIAMLQSEKERKNINPALQNLLKPKEVCDFLGITLPTLAKYRKEGLLHDIKVGRKVFFDPQQLEEDILKIERRRVK